MVGHVTVSLAVASVGLAESAGAVQAVLPLAYEALGAPVER